MLKSKTGIWLLPLSITITTLSTGFVSADQYHYNNMLIGNRASGLAGSYVAISDDPSGLYYNPSGIVYSTSSNITANMNAFNVAKTTFKGALTNSRGEAIDYVRTSSTLVPSFFGITQPLGPGIVGFSYAVTDSILEDQSQTFSNIIADGTEYTLNVNNQDVTNNVGPSYAMSFGNDFSVGLTIYGVFRRQKLIFNRIVNVKSTADVSGFQLTPFRIDNSYYSISEFGIKPILGFSYSPAERISLGLSISQTFMMNSEVKTQTNRVLNICAPDGVLVECTDQKFQLIKTTADVTHELPWEINFGAAYFYSNKLMLTANIWLYESTLDERPATGNSLHDAAHYTILPLINVAAGAEYYITGKLAIRIGAYTNMANTPLEPTINEDEHIDIIGTTMSFTHFSRSSAISIGAAGTFGLGKAAVTGDPLNPQDAEYYGLSVFLSASNSF